MHAFAREGATTPVLGYGVDSNAQKYLLDGLEMNCVGTLDVGPVHRFLAVLYDGAAVVGQGTGAAGSNWRGSRTAGTLATSPREMAPFAHPNPHPLPPWLEHSGAGEAMSSMERRPTELEVCYIRLICSTTVGGPSVASIRILIRRLHGTSILTLAGLQVRSPTSSGGSPAPPRGSRPGTRRAGHGVLLARPW